MDNNPDDEDTVSSYKKAVEKGSEAQREIVKQFSNLQVDAMQNFFSMLQGITFYNAMFKTTVQSGGRISIPEAERQALKIDEGDLVQVIIIPIERKRKDGGQR
jgi:hypothetical protein